MTDQVYEAAFVKVEQAGQVNDTCSVTDLLIGA